MCMRNFVRLTILVAKRRRRSSAEQVGIGGNMVQELR